MSDATQPAPAWNPTRTWTVTEQTIPFKDGFTWVRISTPENPTDLTPVIILHGGPGMAHNYVLPFEGFADPQWGNRTVIHYDQIGCGNSSHHPDAPTDFWTPALFVEEFNNLVQHLGLTSYHIVGQSWGGMLAAEIAVTQPAGLVSVSICNSPASMELWLQGAARLRAELPDGMDEKMKAHEAAGTVFDPDYLACVDEFYRRHVCAIPSKELADSTAQMEAEPTVYHTMNGPNEFLVIGTLTTWSVIDRLHNIIAPTFVLAGEFDEATPETWQPFVDNIPTVQHLVVPNTTHCTHIEQPETVLSALAAFHTAADSGAI